MTRIFVTEAVMLAIYGQLLVPPKPVEYIIPYTTILELYELQTTEEHLMNSSADDQHVKIKIGELISYFEEPLNKRKLSVPCRFPGPKALPFPLVKLPGSRS